LRFPEENSKGEIKMAAVKRIKSPEEWKKRQIETLRAVGQRNYAAGIASPKKDPIEAGIAAEDKWANRVRAAIDAGSRKKALQGTNMSEWASYALAIGAGRLVDGVVKREAKVDKFVRAFAPMLESHVTTLDAMPAVTDSDMEQKMLENLRGLKALKGAWR